VVAKLAVRDGEREPAVARITGAGGRVVDDKNGTLIVEITTESTQVGSCLELLRPYGLTEFARSGPVALVSRRAASFS
jgi:acetolactate synthase small subunit